MDDILVKKLKELTPYIIVTGVIYLLLPLFMGTKESAATYIILLGAFPLTAAGCGAHYAFVRKKRGVSVCLIAPLFYALTALFYGMWRDSWLTVLIYLAAYGLCGYLGIMLSDVLKKSKNSKAAFPPILHRSARPPHRVNVDEDPSQSDALRTEDPAEDNSLDASTTEEDIEQLLSAIHDRKSQ